MTKKYIWFLKEKSLTHITSFFFLVSIALNEKEDFTLSARDPGLSYGYTPVVICQYPFLPLGGELKYFTQEHHTSPRNTK